MSDEAIKPPAGSSFDSISLIYKNTLGRTVDFVLVWKPHSDPDVECANRAMRNMFEERLSAEGLYLVESHLVGLSFIRIYASEEVLLRYAEVLRLRMPMNEVVTNSSNIKLDDTSQIDDSNFLYRDRQSRIPLPRYRLRSIVSRHSNRFRHLLGVDHARFPRLDQRFTAVFTRDKSYLFDSSHYSFIRPSVRSRIVSFILERKRYQAADIDANAFGISRLLSLDVYMAAYPLHDGELDDVSCMRHRLLTNWASYDKCFRAQPLDYISQYLGVKIGIYFAWLGFYTWMLALASAVGVMCFLYALIERQPDVPADETCASDQLMCPMCDKRCDYRPLSTSCPFARINPVFDNSATVFFAAFMSLWATLFLTLWQRYAAQITNRWDLTGFDSHEEQPRPQFLAALADCKRRRENYVTKTVEPEPSFWYQKLPARMLSVSVVMLLSVLVMASVFGVVLYRVSVAAALNVHTSSAQMVAVITAAFINLFMIFVFDMFYSKLAAKLTELELPRTQTEYEDSVTLKLYMLQFVNYYSSIIYIAFFKGNFGGRPGNYNRFLGIRPEQCAIYGCLMELSIQLSIIMIGKQLLGSLISLLRPLVLRMWQRHRITAHIASDADDAVPDRQRRFSEGNDIEQRMVNDLSLLPFNDHDLFFEYLEMVIQYGFVTLFVAAFPLAPLFALINNVFEIRLDSRKFLVYFRRPVVRRVTSIGVWYTILDTLSKLSVITNAFIIAFTSDFVPRLVYKYYESPDGTLHGYVNSSLSVFNVSDLEPGTAPTSSAYPHTTRCYYVDRRNGPDQPGAYELSNEYYTILAWRLMFVVCFENFVLLVMLFVKWAVPPETAELREQIKREAYLTNEIIIKQERKNMLEKHRHNLRRKSVLPSSTIEDLGQITPLNQQATTNNQQQNHTGPESEDSLATMVRRLQSSGPTDQHP